jgi:hypothetical protein
VVRRAEGAGVDQGGVCRQHTGDGVELSSFFFVPLEDIFLSTRQSEFCDTGYIKYVLPDNKDRPHFLL